MPASMWRHRVERPIAMTPEEWEVFEMAGGVNWLRDRLLRMHMSGMAKRNRNNRMRAERKAGASTAELAEKYHLDRTAVHRICKD